MRLWQSQDVRTVISMIQKRTTPAYGVLAVPAGNFDGTRRAFSETAAIPDPGATVKINPQNQPKGAPGRSGLPWLDVR